MPAMWRYITRIDVHDERNPHMRSFVMLVIVVLLVGCNGTDDKGTVATQTPAGANQTETATPADATATVAATETVAVAATATVSATATTAATATATLAPTATPEPTAEPQARIGDTVTFENGGTVTLHAVHRAVPPPQYFSPDAGNEYMTVDFEQCAGTVPAGHTVSSNAFNVEVVLVDNTRHRIAFFTVEPQFTLAALQSGDCNRGLIPFEIPENAQIQRIEFNGYTHDYRNIRARWVMDE
jgi:plastocyanin